MAQQLDALTMLMQQRVGTHTGTDKMSIAQFCAIAIDPDSGYQPSNGLVGKMVRGEQPKMTPQLVGALAEGLGLPREVVAAAAHFQLLGYDEAELEGGAPATVLARLGVKPGEPERAVAERWASETGE
ncbi:hypothetical protein [Streptomyces sp. NPDC017230]|uniref:hypothetical protein n=1 Tax=unclassified Streptomyces TaxID=2593676 RepID=UPI0037A32C7D